MFGKSDVIDKIKSGILKYKYVVPVIVVGVVLLLWPSGGEDRQTSDTTAEPDMLSSEGADSLTAMEEKLASVLSAAEGVGRVRVILSPESGGVTTYAENISSSLTQTDRDGQAAQYDRSGESSIVTTRDASGNETAVIKAQAYPQYRGALIVCDGGDDPTVRLAVIQAVSSLLDIGTDAVQVMKMEV